MRVAPSEEKEGEGWKEGTEGRKGAKDGKEERCELSDSETFRLR